MKNELKNLITTIVELRKEHGLSKKSMAEKLEIGVSSLNKIESGEYPPNLSAKVVINIYKNFGVKPEEQFGDKNE